MPKLTPAEKAVIVAHWSQMLEAAVDAAQSSYSDATGRTTHEFAADALVLLADNLMVTAPDETAALLRALADVADHRGDDELEYKRRKQQVPATFLALEDALPKPRRQVPA